MCERLRKHDEELKKYPIKNRRVNVFNDYFNKNILPLHQKNLELLEINKEIIDRIKEEEQERHTG